MEYYIANGSDRRGPFREEDLPAQGLRGDSMVWRTGLSGWVRADSLEELRRFVPAGGPPPPPGVPPPAYAPQYYPQQSPMEGNRMAAGLCAILIGSLGIHKFILGMTRPGVIMLLVTVLTCGFGAIVMHIIGIVEGIIYLTKSDAEFRELYVVQKKEWF